MAGAQAADLPVKAKPVQYVKICSLYGAGFYYIPGTDTCLKLGGFVRTEWDHNANGSFAPYTSGAEARFTRDGSPLRNRSRAIISIDTRSQTEYGTLRSYLRAGFQWTSGDFQVGGSQGGSNVAGGVSSSSTTYFDRAFIQIAGFTFGKTQSFFDFFNTSAYSLQTNLLWVDTGGSGTPVFAYTAQFGNGFSATLAAEDYTEQRLPIVDVTGGGLGAPGASAVSRHRGYNIPDLVANLRVDQAWGSAQAMGAWHQVAANYYVGANQMAHPDSKSGWAAGLGATLKMPWAAKDTLSGMITWCRGATRYCSNPGGGVLGSGAMFGLVNTTTIGVGWADDAYFDGATIGSSLELAKAWSAVGAFEHYWTSALRTSVYYGYHNYKANSSIVDTAFCGPAAVAFGPGCRNYSAWQLGSRTLWNPVTNLDVGVDIMYTKVNSALKNSNGLVAATAVQGLPPTLFYGNTHVWSGILRVQRNFWP
jgi:hypothetical protein